MSFLRRLLGSSPQPKPEATHASPFAAPPPGALGLEFATIAGDVYEIFRSPDRRWTIGVYDASPDGRLVGSRGGGKGTWVLLQGDRIAARGQLERPNDGRVANDGRFVIADWRFGDSLRCSIYAFGPDGTALINEDFAANAGVTAIAADGSVAVATTLLNRAYPEASDLVVCYDLNQRMRRWSVAGAGPSDGIEIDTAASLVLVRRRDRASFTLDLATGAIRGDFGPEPPASESTNRYAATERLEAAVRAGLPTAETATAEDWLGEAGSLAREFDAAYPGWLARLARIEGEVCERLGRLAEARSAYERALSLDPHVAVRRRLAKLGGTVAKAPERHAVRARDDRPYASTACPTCGITLDPLPRAKRSCATCGAAIYVRGGPDGARHLLRDDQLVDHEAWWERAAVEREREAQEAAERQRTEDAAAGLIVGLYQPEVVGESHYQAALRGLADGEQETSLVVELVREPANPHDPHAVSVRVADTTLGYLARAEAALVEPMLRTLERGRSCRCRAAIRGGFDEQVIYGVFLDGIPDPYETRGGRPQ